MKLGKIQPESESEYGNVRNAQKYGLSSKERHERSQNTAFYLKENSDSVKKRNRKKKRVSRKKLTKINFLSLPKKKKNYENLGKKLQLTPNLGYKKKIPGRRAEFILQKELKRANSYVVKSSDRGSFNGPKSNFSAVQTPKRSLKRKGILRIAQGGRKQMRIRSSAETLKGFNPEYTKPNQDRKLIHNFNIGSLKIRLFAVADGHGKFSYF